ncbi:inorganic phosphate transporter [Geothrix limicola]|uniref:Inorganic phosphate transporter n=1 Tax=Geothrix limicola TaxID=2927978 RepID=A0ABQ5QD37_9BACT|nr:inorganic phosphate transporter [Geothrix limicola]GLH72360.1 inorganic phosphate transporter [Geothrix limicola]
MVLALVMIVLLALAFDYINGFHDTANAIATVVSTGVLSARKAILMAAVLNFGGALLGTQVATTIAKGIADSQFVVPAVIVAALLAAIVWNLITWWFGIPSSSSHALVGGLAGAVVAQAGLGALHTTKLKEVATFLVVSPVVGFFIAMAIIILLLWICRRVAGHRVNVAFRKLQLVSAGAMAFTHGTNDAQKAMGIIALALITYGKLEAHGAKVDVPVWVKLACATAMGLGTMSGGWKIIKTMGSKIVKLKPIHGFAAETSAAIVLFTTAHLGIPVSTTHVISGAIMGVGASMNVSAVRWGVAGNILVAWVLTIPISALLAAGFLKLVTPYF